MLVVEHFGERFEDQEKDMPHDLQITSYYCPSIYKKEVNLLAMNECTTKRKGAISNDVGFGNHR